MIRFHTLKSGLFPLTLSIFGGVGCGAHVQSAADVSAMFNEPAQTIAQKVTTVCQTLKNRVDEPSTKDISLPVLTNCEGGGGNAVNVLSMTTVITQKLAPPTDDAGDKMLSSTRIQLWLNHPLLGLAQLAGNLSKFRSQATSDKSPVDASKAVAVDMKIGSDINLDLEKEIAGSILIGVTTSGLVKADLTLKVGFAVFGQAIAAVLKSTKADGVVDDITAVILLVPHAGDTYLDLIMSVKLSNILEDSKPVDAFAPKFIAEILAMFFDINIDQNRAAAAGGAPTATAPQLALTPGGFQ